MFSPPASLKNSSWVCQSSDFSKESVFLNTIFILISTSNQILKLWNCRMGQLNMYIHMCVYVYLFNLDELSNLWTLIPWTHLLLPAFKTIIAELLTVINWRRKGGKQECAGEKLPVFCVSQNSTWEAIQSTPCQEGNETFQGLLTTPPEIPEDHCHVI